MILRVNEKNISEQKPGYLLSFIAPLEDTVVFQLLLMPDDKRLGLGWWVVGGLRWLGLQFHKWRIGGCVVTSDHCVVTIAVLHCAVSVAVW